MEDLVGGPPAPVKVKEDPSHSSATPLFPVAGREDAEGRGETRPPIDSIDWMRSSSYFFFKRGGSDWKFDGKVGRSLLPDGGLPSDR